MKTDGWKWLKTLCLGALLAAPLAARAQDAGTRVEIKAAAGAELPDPEKIVSQLAAVGGSGHEVTVIRRRTPEGERLTLSLWGPTLEEKDISPTLRQAFPELAGAEITVGAADAKDKPKPEAELARGAGKGKRVKVIKKVVREQ